MDQMKVPASVSNRDMSYDVIGPYKEGTTSLNSIDPKFFNEVAQFAHFGVAAFIYLAIGHIAAKRGFFHWSWYGALIALGVVAAAVKEFWYDKNFENEATRGSDLEDFTFYVLGIAAAVATLIL